MLGFLTTLVYIFVLFGSIVGLCALLGAQVFVRNRSVKKFVRSVGQRSEAAVERGVTMEETVIERPRTNARTRAIELQEARTFSRQAEKAFAQGRVDEAERLYIQALTADNNAHDIQAQLAKLYLKTQRYAKAEALYKELVAKVADASYLSNLGLSCYLQGKYADACVFYEEALERDPANAERQFALGRARMAAGDYDEAAQLLEKASQRLSRNTELLNLLAECYLQCSRRSEAEHAYKRLNKIEPYNTEVKEKLAALAA